MSDELSRLAGSCLMVGFEGLEAEPRLLDQIGAGAIGGVIFFARNLSGGPEQVAALTRRLQSAAPPGLPLLIGIDQEGGRVQRLRQPLAVWPPMRRLGELDDERLTERVGAALGAELALLGFNLDFAPVLDVVSSPENTVIGDRSFGSDPERVSRHGLALASGLRAAGLLPCGKHFPGHGGPVADSHHALPLELRPVEQLHACDLLPFQAAVAARFPLLMSAHVIYRGIDAAHAGTLSRAVCTELLREQLGFEGVLISDDMEMAAIADRLDPGVAALSALRAGIDLLLFCHRQDRQQAAIEALARAARSSPADLERLQQAAARVSALRQSAPLPPPPPRELLTAFGRHQDVLAELAARSAAAS